jgi:predicted transcriptional regulator
MPKRRKGGSNLAEKMFMRVDEIAEALDVSTPYAYKLIRQLNAELKKKGCITIAGRIDRRFFYEKFYGSNTTI